MPAPVASRSFLMSAAVMEAMSLLVSGVLELGLGGSVAGRRGVGSRGLGLGGGRLGGTRALDGARVDTGGRGSVTGGERRVGRGPAGQQLLLPLGERLVAAELARLRLVVRVGAGTGAGHQ